MPISIQKGQVRTKQWPFGKPLTHIIERAGVRTVTIRYWHNYPHGPKTKPYNLPRTLYETINQDTTVEKD